MLVCVASLAPRASTYLTQSCLLTFLHCRWNRLSDERLSACGLLQQHGKQLGVSVNEWEKLQNDFRLDVEATHR
jgi:hypothetical protein